METVGHYTSEDHMTSIAWALPTWSDLAQRLCSFGFHIVSRKVVVVGFMQFTQVKRAYCACGRKCWIWYDRGWADSETTEPGAHLSWIQDFTSNLPPGSVSSNFRAEIWPQ